MKTNQQITRWLALLMLGLLSAGTATVSAQGTVFNYQGRLNVNGMPASGSYDLTFDLFSDSGGINRLSNTLTNLNTDVTNGLFAVILDFGPWIFTGTSAWMEIGVRTNGGSAFTHLTPLQPILPVPYAIMANTASNLLGTLPAGQLSGLLSASQLSGTVSDGRLSGNVAFLNASQTFSGVNAFDNPGNNFTGSFQGNGAGLSNLSNGVPASALVLSRTVSNPNLNAAGFNLYATQLGRDWVPVNTSMPWGQRAYCGAITNIGRMWVLGGRSGGVTKLDDVWSSADGQSWNHVMSGAPWGKREGHMTIVLDETFFILGGVTNNNSGTDIYLNDVWSSQGGTNWFRVTAAARWSPRWYSASLVFNDRIWVLGGIGGSNFYNDVWYSPDGLNWIVGTTAAAWAGRQGHAAVVFNGKMWVMGGLRSPDFTHANDVWSSSDGTNWTQVTSAAAWSPRTYFTLTAFNGKMWVLGGHDLSIAGYRNDVWSSVDGVTWTQATNAAAWGGRQAHAALAFNERLWVLGGLGNSYYNDAWSSQGITNMVGQFYLFQKQ
jgi:hypothetical protein